MIQINEFCRVNGIKYLMSDVCGLFAWSFSDFGEDFDVLDLDGEEYSDHYIAGIKQSHPALVEVQDKKFHNLENNDFVQFSEIEGMSQLNGQIAQVQVINSYSFTIDIQVDGFDAYKSNGSFRKVKIPKKMKFNPLAQQIESPDLIFSELSELKYYHPFYIHICLHALQLYYELNTDKLEDYLKIVLELFEKHVVQQAALNKDYLIEVCRVVYFTRISRFPPLCAFLGGVVAQEALKSITNKFTPIKQWFHLDCIELFEARADLDKLDHIYVDLSSQQDRYTNLRECFGGRATLTRLGELRLFMVGCGAIGCEMLKNYALLGVACHQQTGLITITDNDLIEKSNLNRQFLFRQEDIQKAKSLAAQAAVLKINPHMNIIAYEKKVCPQTEADLFTDDFFQSQDVCVNALGK